jgi:succinate-semialdehyde dehydrogenase/glutarate-semialdehyde dehydrogenase
VPHLGADEARRAVEAAARALETPTPLARRRDWLLRLSEQLLSHRDELGEIITLENGKPLSEARGEVEYAAGFFRYAADHIDALRPRRVEDRPRDHDWMVHFRPAGVAALITPWNFPLAMLAKKLPAALAADCSVVVKPAEATPLSAIALFAILDGLEMPAGKVNLVFGDPAEIGGVLCSHPAVRLISFTGSTEVGRLLIANTAPHVQRLSLELGGNAPFIVFADADLEAAADHLIPNKFRCSGQTCVCTNRVYIQREAAPPFLDLVVERVSRLKAGNGLEEGTHVGPLIDQAGFDKVSRHVRNALAGGARALVGGEAPPRKSDGGWLFPPTVLSSVTDDMHCVKEETFGPIVPVIEFEDESEVVRRANGTEFGLAAYVFTGDEKRAERVIRSLHFGHVGWNTGTGPTPEAPFGGMKQSGFGREGGLEGLFEFTEAQTVPRGK